MAEDYKWNFQSVGGVVRVKISTGEDIVHLGELDQKMWTVLSCPASGLEFDQKTLQLLDTDNDGKIKVKEVIAAADWICSVVKDKDSLLKGDSSLPLDNINVETPEGLKLYNSARQILANLGLDKSEISVDDTADSVAIFAGTKFNGDGIIIPASSEDPDIQKTIQSCIDTIGSNTDRSGEAGVNAEQIEAFYTALQEYSDWMAETKKSGAVLPFGDKTADCLAACDVLKDKIADFFMRCKLICFDGNCNDAVDVSVEKIASIRNQNLATCSSEIAECPLARPNADKLLPFDAINPAWKKEFDALKALVLDSEFAGKTSINEDEWNALLTKFDAFRAWKDAEKGSAVAGLGIETVNEILKAAKKEEILSLIAKDEALKEESESIDSVDKLLHFYRDFYKFLMNFVTFRDFYAREGKDRADFEVGELFIDQRCCKLCIRVEDMGKHADMAGLSGMFLIYCTCVSKSQGKTMDIVSVLTGGKTSNIRVGTNALFYDRYGQDWDAVVTKVVDNPISVKQAFWSPYRKFANFCSEKINKFASDKESNVVGNMQTVVGDADLNKVESAGKQPFDIAKFAGIFAALGMALGLIADALVGVFKGIFALKFWQLLLAVIGIMLVISGPSCFIAWMKLRKRNLGPVLNANGWAINSSVLVNTLFGSTLTSVAKYPVFNYDDPFVPKKTPAWKKWLTGIVIIALIVAAFFVFDIKLSSVKSLFTKDKAVAEQVVEEADATETEDVVEIEAVQDVAEVEAETVVEE